MLLKMGCSWLFFNIFFLLPFHGLTGAGQESTIQLLNVYDTSSELLPAMPHSLHALAVSVSDEVLGEVSSSVLEAETWLRTHVLAHFPAQKITTIVVGKNARCKNGLDHHNFGLVLPSLKNIYHSLKRWGLEREIKVSAAFSSNCFDSHSDLFQDELVEGVTKALLEFLHFTNSTFSIIPPPKLLPFSDETVNLVYSHLKFVRKLVSFDVNKVNVITTTNPKQNKPLNRKSLIQDSKTINPFPARPTPLPEASQPPLHSSIGFSIPANMAKIPLPPLSHATSLPPLSIPHSSPPPIEPPPLTSPASPPYVYTMPPCNPGKGAYAPAPEIGVVQRLWCVAKPSVPAETLQEAMDYACGEGGGNCKEIMLNGSCFYPDTVVAHASYAFNSYWQKNKRSGGTCSFGGTAMLINSDPSFLHCRFVLS